MHRYVAFVLLLSLFLFPCTSFAADLNGVQFTQGEPHRSLDFRQYFELMTTTQEPCTLSIQSEIFDSDQAYSLFCTVMEDMFFSSSTGRYENSEGCAPFPVWRWSWNNGAVIFRQRAGTRSAVAESGKVNFLRLFSERSEMTLSLSLIELTFLPATFPRKRVFHVQNLTFRDKKVGTRILMLY